MKSYDEIMKLSEKDGFSTVDSIKKINAIFEEYMIDASCIGKEIEIDMNLYHQFSQNIPVIQEFLLPYRWDIKLTSSRHAYNDLHISCHHWLYTLEFIPIGEKQCTSI